MKSPTLLGLLFMSLFMSQEVFAHLGGDENSIENDAHKLAGQHQVTQHPHYALHEISQDWMRVREFADSDGKVFAVAWRGKKHPDLQNLLGSHLAEFQSALGQSSRKGYRHGGDLVTTVGNLHVELGGHLGATYGRVWLNDQVPAGVDSHEIK